MEQWVILRRFPNHEISTHGRIRNARTGHILKPSPDRYGYLRLSIGSTDNVYIHRLMCETFYGPPEHPDMQVNHLDADRQNNHILNLQWCSSSDNIRWAIHRGNCDPMVGLQKAQEVNRRSVRLAENGMVFPSVKECAEYLGVNPNRVSRCLIGERRGQTLHGYHVEYA